MHVCEIPFLTGIDKQPRFRAATYLTDLKKETVYRAIDLTMRLYNNAGYTVKTIQCDGYFKPLFEEVKDNLEVRMNYTNAD
jgi:hypothetical protein